ncbi:hypothetical protein ACIRP2_38785 [Streptomyces sp. NPDC101194]|uniref:hypothetical protein n=1 Tax=Streptomyces sp. NPDC101194 TaxID=3366127 RepID=UPI0038301B2B
MDDERLLTAVVEILWPDLRDLACREHGHAPGHVCLMALFEIGSDRSFVNPQVSGGLRERFVRGTLRHGGLLAG